MAITHFIKEEKAGVKDYERAEKHSKGEEKEVYKEILPDEKKHIEELKEAKSEKAKEKKRKMAKKMK